MKRPLDCPLYHDTDGHCCTKDEPCLFTPTPSIILDNSSYVEDLASLNRRVMWIWIVAILACSTVFGAVALERQDRAIQADTQESAR